MKQKLQQDLKLVIKAFDGPRMTTQRYMIKRRAWRDPAPERRVSRLMKKR